MVSRTLSIIIIALFFGKVVGQTKDKILIKKVTIRYSNSAQKTNPLYRFMHQFGTWKLQDSIVYCEKFSGCGEDTFNIINFERYQSDFKFLIPLMPATVLKNKKVWKTLSFHKEYNKDTVTFVFEYNKNNEANFLTEYYTYDVQGKLIKYFILGSSYLKWFSYFYDNNGKLRKIDDGHSVFDIEYYETGFIKKVYKSSGVENNLYLDSFLEFQYEY